LKARVGASVGTGDNDAGEGEDVDIVVEDDDSDVVLLLLLFVVVWFAVISELANTWNGISDDAEPDHEVVLIVASTAVS